jgi:putative ABC transport system permease protein
MVGLSLRGLVTRKLRTALTALAIVLGIAFVSGTYILTDTMNASFDTVFETANAKTDVAITPRQQFDGADTTSIPASLLRQVERVDGVALAAGDVSEDTAIIYERNGEDALVRGGAPMILNGEMPSELSPLDYVEGHEPAAPGEIALDKGSADKGGFALGDTVEVSADGPKRAFRLVGIAKFGEEDSLAGASLAIVQTPVAQEMLDMRGQFTSITVAAAPGVSPQRLADRIRAELDSSLYNVRTGEQEARRQATDLQDQLSFLNTFLLAFAGISLFVGAFLIVNTYSITVAQRMREFAVLRMIGASRRQVLRAVLGEALVVGFVASAIGFLAGFGVAPALMALFKAFGAEFPSGGLVLETRTVVVSLVVGTLVTVVAATGPALRATRIPPIAALQDAAALTRGRTGRLRTPLAILVSVAGVALILAGLLGDGSGGQAAALVGAGAACVFIGVGLLASHLVRPLAKAVGLPLERLRGVPGRLARENATRQPRRSASTAAALMIGVALVAFVAIFAAGLKASIDDAVDRGVKGELVVQSETFQPIPRAASRALAAVPGVETVSPIRFANARVEGTDGTTSVTGVDPATVGDVLELTWTDGSAGLLARLGDGQALVSDDFAADNDLSAGSRLTVRTPAARTLELRVTGIYDAAGGLLANMTLSNAVLDRDFDVQRDAFVIATTAPGDSADAVQRVADRAVSRAFPTVEVLTKEGFKDDQARQIDGLLSLVYVLLSLSVIVSLFGIVNTLVLSIHERTRELGMLRAIGTSRKQVRQIVRYEAVITALIGAVLGVVLGAVFAVLVTIPLRSEGFTISIPVPTLIVLLILAALAGVLAAILPARRAAKLDVLRALAYE